MPKIRLVREDRAMHTIGPCAGSAHAPDPGMTENRGALGAGSSLSLTWPSRQWRPGRAVTDEKERIA